MLGWPSLRSIVLQCRREGESAVVSRDAADGPAAHRRNPRARLHASADISARVPNGISIHLREGNLAAGQGVACSRAGSPIVEEIIVGVIRIPTIAPLALVGITALQRPALQAFDLHCALERVVIARWSNRSSRKDRWSIRTWCNTADPGSCWRLPGTNIGLVGIDIVAGADEAVPVRVSDIGSRWPRFCWSTDAGWRCCTGRPSAASSVAGRNFGLMPAGAGRFH